MAEFDFTIQYRPGRLHQVPDALSRLIQTRGTMELQLPVDDDTPGIDSDDDDDAPSNGGYDDVWSHRVLYIQEKPL